MTPERYRQIKDLFLATLERPHAERAAFLDERSAGDAGLRSEVQELLDHYHESDDPADANRRAPTRPAAPAGEPEGAAARQGADAPGAAKAGAGGGGGGGGGAFPPGGTRSRMVVDYGRFPPGTVVDGRYRVVDLIERGGMGEVYRADDLKLNQPVALKFLPKDLARNREWLERLLEEVRVARTVSHPNICRVFDVGEIDGDHYISMEYVDGETLASLTSRIGRLPQKKASELGQQLCAGLAAVHDQGILHRDLKPANIMIDGRGQLRVTDFGLAVGGEVRGMEAAAGTPGYVAPEALSGKEATVRSDIYALGLVLYEMFTGQAAYPRNSGKDLIAEQQKNDPPAASTVAPDILGRAERAIQACLERDPRMRPASVRLVSSMLPGGDPLSAILEAGHTPSPSQVAMAGRRGLLKIWQSGALLGGFVLALVVALTLGARASLIRVVQLPLPPEVLAEKSRDALRALGYKVEAGSEAYSFDLYEELLGEMEAKDTSARRWDKLRRDRPAPIDFWYRLSPRPMGTQGPTGVVTMEDPPQIDPGMIAVRMTPRGRLRELAVIDPDAYWPRSAREGEPLVQGPPAVGPPLSPVDWAPLFVATGLDQTKFEAVEPERIPPVFADARAAWKGVYPESPDEPVTVEAAALRGRVVAFRLVETRYPQAQIKAPTERSGTQLWGQVLAWGVFVLTLVGAGVLARQNIAARRGDRHGAIGVAVFVLLMSLAGSVLTADTLRSVDAPLGNVGWMLGAALLTATYYGLLYIAVEPYVRRVWPETLISWTRLTTGRLTEPLVGQSLLAGSVVGMVGVVVFYTNMLTPGWMGLPPARPFIDDQTGVSPLNGLREALGQMVSMPLGAMRIAFTMLASVVLLKLILRRNWLALVAFGIIQTTIWTLSRVTTPFTWGLYGLIVAACLLLLVRYGLLALMAAVLVFIGATNTPITLDARAWYAGTGFLALFLVLLIPAYGAVTSVVGRKIE